MVLEWFFWFGVWVGVIFGLLGVLKCGDRLLLVGVGEDYSGKIRFSGGICGSSVFSFYVLGL